MPSRIIVFLASAVSILGFILLISLAGGCSSTAKKIDHQPTEQDQVFTYEPMPEIMEDVWDPLTDLTEEVATDLAGDPGKPPEDLLVPKDTPPIKKDEGVSPPPEFTDTPDIPSHPEATDTKEAIDAPDIIDIPVVTDTKEVTPPPQDDYTIFFINVGQGDSMLIKTNQGHYVLIDAGPPDKDNTLNAFLTAKGVTDLATIILSHPHQDHYGELPDVLDAFPAASFRYANYPSKNVTYQAVLDAVDAKGIPRIVTKEGTVFNLDNLSFTFLHPPLSGFVSSADGENDNSLTVKVCNVSLLCFLAGGDLEADGIDALLANHSTAIDVELLKVHHHGSLPGTTQSLLDATTPSAAFILVGPNGYGHPSPSTLQLLKSNGITTYRTDTAGSIGVYITSSTYAIDTSLPY
ncbi:MAG: MBL fold metallo-hydrolase [Candidatus Saganbacteria bacterium]|nr:MBL fold metallo-hydrolase [Candidatus Saganbacteria bacterium]